jgi:uncharacterized protein YdaU (DUF1376 family)
MNMDTNSKPTALGMTAQFERVKHLAADQIGAAMLLTSACLNDGSLPDDDKALRRVARLTAYKWGELRASLQSFFIVRDSVWKLPEAAKA